MQNRRSSLEQCRRFAAPAGLILLLGTVFGADAQATWLRDHLAARFPRVIFFADTDEAIIALTIDDGPDPATTPRILELLRKHHARATFFLIGERVVGNEALVGEIVADGHELGNHLWRDEPSIQLSEEEFASQLQRTHAVLAPIAHHPLNWFRPASGMFDEKMLDTAEQHGYACVLGTVYPLDAQLAWPWFSERVIDWFARPGSIVILHDGGNRGLRTTDVLERALPRLDAKGYRVVTVSELVGRVEPRLTRLDPSKQEPR